MHADRFSRTPVRCLLLGFALLPAGCYIHSEVPLSDPDKATANEKLLGKWVAQTDVGLAVSKPPAEGYPPGVMMLRVGDNYTLFFCTESKGNTYANLCGRWVLSPAKLPTWDKARKGPFGIVKFKVADHSLVVWDHDETLLQESVLGGKLKGIIQKPPPGDHGWPTALLQESTADLMQFVQREDKKLFPTKGTLKRVR
jgi:hypothetical protein